MQEEDTDLTTSPKVYSTFKKVWTCLFFAVSSILITIVNKIVLTTYEFPSFLVLATAQTAATVIILFVAKQCSFIRFTDFSPNIFRKMTPLQFIYLGNMMSGLGGTKELSLPMFSMLRRFAILMTMVAEFYILDVRYNYLVQSSVLLMVLGAVIAAKDDLGFTLQGYVFLLINDLFTAAHTVVIKKMLNTQKEIGRNGLLFYSCVFVLPLLIVINFGMGDLVTVYRFKYWKDTMFLAQFCIACTMGFVLNYSTMLCIQCNSALTSSVVGGLKNVFIVYLGMFVGGDYRYSTTNFIGINLSVFGCLWYTYVVFKSSTPAVRRECAHTV